MAIWGQIKDVLFRVLSALGIYFIGRRSGAKDEQHRQHKADTTQARKVQDAADRVRRADGGNLSPVERLQKYNRIRDDKGSV